MKFEIKDRDAAGRICRFTTKHGTVTTPNLMPVINPNKILISPKEMKKLFNVEIVITNSYIINKDKQLREKALEEGVHRLIGFDGAIMTDSGAFQSYVYGDIELDPIEIVEFQRDIGSDIGTILDVFGTPDQTREEAERGLEETVKRARESMPLKKDMFIAFTVQGSIYPNLRQKCAEQLSEIGADFYPIGGIVPLMENQRYADMVRCIISSKQGLDPSKPVHLFGAGHPLVFPLAVALGCDLFDSSAYAKYANDKRMIFPWGTEKLDDLQELPCCCPVCTRYTASELRKMEEKEAVTLLARHNLYVSFAEIKKIKNAISEGKLWELVERQTGSNPYLDDALRELRKDANKAWLEKFEPLSKKKALFYTGVHTFHRPIIYRCHRRLLTRYEQLFSTTVVFPESAKPYSAFYSKYVKGKMKVNLVVDSHLGPVPFELDEMYPFAQSVVPKEVDKETFEESRKIFNEFLKGKQVIVWKEGEPLPSQDTSERNEIDFDLRRIHAVADMQFGRGASKALFHGDIRIVRSKKTGKIRSVYVDGKHVLSMRASDGLFTLKIDGARLLHGFFKFPKLRVVVSEDAVPFVSEGKSVFSKFVKDCDPDLIPLDECIIVDEKDNILGVGRCLLNRVEMLKFNYGVAVKTR
jgi:7-cyano-7-deazaguanine tRNA-ribosyltransferase